MTGTVPHNPRETPGRGDAEWLGGSVGLGLGVACWVVVARTFGVWFLLGCSTGLMVKTDSIMPATRQTARMLAISGTMPAWAGRILRSRRRRRIARSSRR